MPMTGLEKSDAHAACEALCVSAAALAEDVLERAVIRPSGGLRGYRICAAKFQRMGAEIAALGAAMEILVRASLRPRP